MDTTLSDLNIRYIKLINGETILAFVHDTLDVDHNMMLEEPMLVNIADDNEYVLTPWLPFSTDSVHMLNSYQVLMESNVVPWMKAQYLRFVLDIVDSTASIDQSRDKDTILH